MSGGFWAWVAGPGGTLAGMSVALVVGTALGWLGHAAPRRVSRRERRELADAAADRAARQFRRMRQPELRATDPEHMARRAAMATRTHPVYRERKTSTAAFLSAPPYRSGIEDEARQAHEASALAVALDQADPTVTGWTQAAATWLDQRIEEQHADTDRFLAGLLGGYPVPWPDGGER